VVEGEDLYLHHIKEMLVDLVVEQVRRIVILDLVEREIRHQLHHHKVILVETLLVVEDLVVQEEVAVAQAVLDKMLLHQSLLDGVV
jgi:cell division protein FtsB